MVCERLDGVHREFMHRHERVPTGRVVTEWGTSDANDRGGYLVVFCLPRSGWRINIFSGTFGTSSPLSRLWVDDDPIQRSIGHIIKYSERPTPCSVPFDQAHYTVSDRLSPHQLS